MNSTAAQHIEFRGHIRALDGLRGLAITMVLFHHLWPYVWDNPLYTIFSKIKHVGWIGVDLFFVLSGFLITGILLDSRHKPNYFRNFIARRSLRIFPLYFFFLFLAFTVVPLLLAVLGITDPQLSENRQLLPWFVLYLSNYLHLFHDPAVVSHLGFDLVSGMDNGLHTFLAVTWSLSVEEQFYLLWPVVVLLLGCRLRGVVFGVCLAAIAARAVVILTLGDWAHVANMATFCRMDSLALGSLLAHYVRSDGFHLRAWKSTTSVGTWIGLPLLIAWLSFGAGRSSPIFAAFGYSLSAICFACLLGMVICRNSNPVKRILESSLLVWFGKYSYGLYLYHMLVLYLVDLWKPAHTAPDGTIVDPGRFQPFFGNVLYDAPIRLLLVSVITILLAWMSFHFLESPILRLKRHFADKQRLPTTVPTSPGRGPTPATVNA
jgi:peptidoglycan/LPS O-acetylase OafA/YrhL